MTWVVVGAWILAALVAVVILGFCAYELATKAKRLQADLARLQTLNADLAVVQRGMAEAQDRLAAVQLASKTG